jgi:hypothetical protein
MRSIQVIRNAVKDLDLYPPEIHMVPGYGRIYDDIWPLNIAGMYCNDLTDLVKPYLDERYPDGWEANTHMILMTNWHAYLGHWHRDAPPYEEDTIIMLCLAGHDKLELDYAGPYCPDLIMGDLLLMPAATIHRGRCDSYRRTYHARVGPKGKVMPESPMDVIPPMTVTRFLKRTYRTLRYYATHRLG